MRTQIVILLQFILFSLIPTARACTVIVLQNDSSSVLIKQHMNTPGLAHIMTNVRGLHKTAFIQAPEEPVRWAAKYGSVTINEIAKEMPNAGMNEAGLIIESTGLNETVYPDIDDRQSLNSLQWMQYHLDNSQTVFDVIASDSMIRIGQAQSYNHFIVSDREGNTAVIEFIGGKMLSYVNSEFHPKVLANSTYEESLVYLSQFKGFGGDNTFTIEDTLVDRSSLGSFVVGAKLYLDSDTAELSEYAAHAHAKLRELGSDWEVTYDNINMKLWFKSYKNNNLKIIDLNEIDFNCNATEQVLSYNTLTEGAGNEYFVNYTTEINREVISTIFEAYTFLNHIPDALKEQLAIYPESFRCRDESGNNSEILLKTNRTK